jgi:hypothetical protein
MSIGSTFNSLPPWAKGTIAVIGTVGVVAIGYYGVKAVKTFINNKNTTGQDKEVGEATSELQKLNKDSKTKQKLSKLTIETIANAIKDESDGIGLEHNYYWAVSTQLNKLQNDADYLALVDAFGVRTINSGIYFVPDFKGTLSQVIHHALPQGDVDDLNKLLKKKGIKYRL